MGLVQDSEFSGRNPDGSRSKNLPWRKRLKPGHRQARELELYLQTQAGANEVLTAAPAVSKTPETTKQPNLPLDSSDRK